MTSSNVSRRTSDPTMTMLPWEAALVRIRAVARECGYAVGLHGSTTRDLDLVAVPWTPEAVSASHLVDRLCDEVPLVEKPNEPGLTPALGPDRKPVIGWVKVAPTHFDVVDPATFLDTTEAAA